MITRMDKGIGQILEAFQNRVWIKTPSSFLLLIVDWVQVEAPEAIRCSEQPRGRLGKLTLWVNGRRKS